MIGKCGHEIDAWWGGTNTVCQTCFEGQGFQYNRNGYRDIEAGHRGGARSGMGTALRGDPTTDDRKAEIASIVNGTVPGSKERRRALAVVRERFNVGKSTAHGYAAEFRLAA